MQNNGYFISGTDYVIYIAVASPNSKGIVIGHVYGTNAGGALKYSSFIYNSLGGTIFAFGYSNSNYYINKHTPS